MLFYHDVCCIAHGRSSVGNLRAKCPNLMECAHESKMARTESLLLVSYKFQKLSCSERDESVDYSGFDLNCILFRSSNNENEKTDLSCFLLEASISIGPFIYTIRSVYAILNSSVLSDNRYIKILELWSQM